MFYFEMLKKNQNWFCYWNLYNKIIKSYISTLLDKNQIIYFGLKYLATFKNFISWALQLTYSNILTQIFQQDTLNILVTHYNSVLHKIWRLFQNSFNPNVLAKNGHFVCGGRVVFF